MSTKTWMRDMIFLGLAAAVGIGALGFVHYAMPGRCADGAFAAEARTERAQIACRLADSMRPAEEPNDLAAEGYAQEETGLSYIPLDKPLAQTLMESCGEYGVPLELALAVMERESGFDAEAVNPTSGCYGLMQLNPKYFPGGLAPEENIRAGTAYLGELLKRYDGDQGAALTAYNAGHDTGGREYAGAVLAAAEGWLEQEAAYGQG